MDHDGKEEEAPRRKIETLTLQKVLARQDVEQATVIRAWADEIDARARAIVSAPGDPTAAEAAAIAGLFQLGNAMRATAANVETFATALLERLERGGAPPR